MAAKGRAQGGRSGGPRVGAGRPRSDDREFQRRMRDAFQQAVTFDDWKAIVAVAVEQAKGGDDKARTWLAPWLVGRVPEEVKVAGEGVIFVAAVPRDRNNI